MPAEKVQKMRETMTAETATTFSGYSVANAIAVRAGLADRGCSCEPYADVFTFNRWRAQGRTVLKGEHGIKIPVIVRGQTTDKETGEEHGFSMRRASAGFRPLTVARGYSGSGYVGPVAGPTETPPGFREAVEPNRP